VITSENKGTGC